MKEIKVLQIGADNLGYGGRSVAIYNLTQNIESREIRNDFLYFGNKVPNKCITGVHNKNGKIVDIGKSDKKNRLVREFIRSKKIISVVKKNRYDIVHINADNAYEAMKSLIIVKIGGVKNIVIHAHSTGNAKKNGWFVSYIVFLSQIMLRKEKAVKLACSKEAEKYMFGNNSSNTVILKNGIDLAKFQYNANTRKQYRKMLNIENKLVVGCVARLSESKNHLFLIDIFNSLYKECNNAVLLLIGEGHLKEDIVQKVKEYGIEDNVIFLGNRIDVSELLQAMDVFCLTSICEGFGIVNIEAQASGLSCVVSDVVPQMAKVNDNFLFLNLNDNPQKWVENIRICSKDKRISEIEKLREKGFDIKDSAQILEKIYRECMDEQKTSFE